MRFSWGHFPGALLQAFGALWLLIQATDFFFSDPAWTAFVRSIWWLFCICGLLIAIRRAWPKRSVEARIKDTDVMVEIRIGNILKQDGAIIVGSNTTFDTSLEDGTISKSSVQGQFTEQHFDNVRELDQKLDQALKPVSSTATRTTDDKPYGKVKEYELGTVAPIEFGGRKAYFVAIARLNSERVASSDANAFQDALPKIWNGLRSRGGMEKLVCPVLGSGYSRLKLTRKELVQAIIRSFVVASQEGKLTEKLSIVVRPEDLRQGQLSLEDLHRFLECECLYTQAPRTPESSQPTGTPLQ